MSTQPEPPADRPEPRLVPVRRRRDVRFTPWLVTGGLLGAAAGTALSVLGDSEPRYTDTTQAGFMAMMGAFLGVLVAGLAAALVDVALTRRR